MRFMIVRTWEPHESAEIAERRMEKGRMTPEGIKVLGEWLATDGGTQFLLMEADSNMPSWKWCLSWGDLGKNRSFHVVEVKDDKATQLS